MIGLAKGSSKVDKALTDGVTVICENELMEMLQNE